MAASFLEPPSDPFVWFREWYEAADACQAIQYAGAMCLSTVSADGFPEGRIVLLHGAGPEGFAFFTDRRSDTGQSLEHTPRAALTFYWGPLERQIRVQGRVVRGMEAEADAFFEKRPRRSKCTAWASPQSQPITTAELDRRMREVEDEYGEHDTIPRPPYWQVYRVRPQKIEFWEARSRRLHDRVRYTRTDEDGWSYERLAP